MSQDPEIPEQSAKKALKLPLILGLVLALAGGGGGFYAVYSGMVLGGGDGASWLRVFVIENRIGAGQLLGRVGLEGHVEDLAVALPCRIDLDLEVIDRANWWRGWRT